ncbi:hypothetical protein [Methylobacterium sp. JK268]
MTLYPFQILEEQRRGSFPPQAHVDWFASQGVAALDLFMTWDGYAHPVRIDRVAFLGNDRFEFERHLRRERDGVVTAYTVTVRDVRGYVADIAAFHPRSGRVAVWRGACAMLGEEELFCARMRDALRVHLDPLGWLKAQRQGVVVVNDRRARPLLLEAGPLQCASVEHGRALLGMLSRTRLPTVLADAPEEAA